MLFSCPVFGSSLSGGKESCGHFIAVFLSACTKHF